MTELREILIVFSIGLCVGSLYATIISVAFYVRAALRKERARGDTTP